MSDQSIHHLAAAYALDALDADERVAFEAHLPGCESCGLEVSGFSATAAELAAATATEPPAGLKTRVMDEIGRTRQESPTTASTSGGSDADAGSAPVSGPATTPVGDLAERRRRRTGILSAAAAVLILGVGVVAGWALNRDDGAEPSIAAVIEADDALVLDLETPPDIEGVGGVVQVVYSPGQDGAVLVGSKLGDAPADHEYELWYFHADGVTSAGTFPVDGGRVHRPIDLSGFDGIPSTGFGITIEPVDGTPEPEGDVIYAATI